MARWSKLERILRVEAQPAHPPEAALLAFETDPGTLHAEERRSIRLHLDSCAPCRDALAAVCSLDLESAVGLTAAASVEAEAIRQQSWLVRLFGSLRETLGSLLQPHPSPVLVVAALVLLGIPLGLLVWSMLGPRMPAAPHGPGSAPDLVASEEPALERPAPEPALDTPLVGDEPTHPIPSEGVEPESPGELEPAAGIVVAALMPANPLVYSPPVGPAGVGPGRISHGRRSAAGAPAPLALAPNHVGRTVRSSPTLHWFLAARADHRIEFALLAPEAIDPIFMSTIDPPLEPGFHAVALGDHGVTLEPGVQYRWTVALVLDEDQRQRDVIGGGVIERIGQSPALLAELEKAGPGAAGHTYAANGLWYDALDFVSQWIVEKPTEQAARSRRGELLAQAGLETAADYDRRAIGAQ